MNLVQGSRVLAAFVVASLWLGCAKAVGAPGWEQQNEAEGEQGGDRGATSSSMGSGGAGGSVPSCGPGATMCDQACTVLSVDPAHCGACGNPCGPDEVCSSGVCKRACFGGTTLCGAACVDTQHDPTHCGSCEKACNAGEVCSLGQCGLTCLGGSTRCNDACIDTQNNPAHCGGCGQACPDGTVCSMGQCTIKCLGGTTRCGDLCVETSSDPAHCGGCGKACADGQVCADGTCLLLGACSAPFTQCGNICTNTQTDAKHCGACGHACPLGYVCSAGSCQTCDSSTTDCDGDGWLLNEGDCCDKPGLCGADPSKVNPGAIEVVGNGIDDNCNAKTDLFDMQDTVSCDDSLMSNSTDPIDYAKALGICRTTTLDAPKSARSWGLIEAKILRVDGSPLQDMRAMSIRSSFGNVSPAVLEGKSIVVMSSGIAADATQTNPGPNGGAPQGHNVSAVHGPTSIVTIDGGNEFSVKDWYAAENLPLKPANGLPNAPGCKTTDTATAKDSVMLVLRLRAPTNARAFSFNSFFLSAEYPEFVCTNYNDQFVALVDTPTGVPFPTPNPVDKNLMTYTSEGQKWPIGINIAKGTNLFAVCDSQTDRPACWDNDVSATSCSLGSSQLAGTGFEAKGQCLIGGATFWLTTAGNVIPGEIVELRIAVWDVGDTAYDSLALLDGFQWLPTATLPGTGG